MQTRDPSCGILWIGAAVQAVAIKTHHLIGRWAAQRASKRKNPMASGANTYRPGHYTGLGFLIGLFVGILADQLALGMIFGFFIGAAIDANKRRAAAADSDTKQTQN